MLLYSPGVHASEVATQRYFKNMQQIYKTTPMPKFDFNKVTLQRNFVNFS